MPAILWGRKSVAPESKEDGNFEDINIHCVSATWSTAEEQGKSKVLDADARAFEVKVINQLAMANSAHCYSHVFQRKDGHVSA